MLTRTCSNRIAWFSPARFVAICAVLLPALADFFLPDFVLTMPSGVPAATGEQPAPSVYGQSTLPQFVNTFIQVFSTLKCLAAVARNRWLTRYDDIVLVFLIEHRTRCCF